jgi:hypothetical protein
MIYHSEQGIDGESKTVVEEAFKKVKEKLA